MKQAAAIRAGTVEDDGALVRRMTAGDSSAVGDLYDRHGRAMYSLACRILSDPAEAEDVVQEVFAQAWRQRERYDERRAAVAGWLLMMTRTRSIDRIRARQARPAIAAGDAEPILQRQHDPGPGPEATALTLDVAARVRAALGELTDVQRRALELAYFEGLSQSDIAERLREPLGTVKTRIRTALQKLRAVMERG